MMTAPRINHNMEEGASKDLQIIEYIDYVIHHQNFALGKDIEACEAFLNNIRIEKEIDAAWEGTRLVPGN